MYLNQELNGNLKLNGQHFQQNKPYTMAIFEFYKNDKIKI